MIFKKSIRLNNKNNIILFTRLADSVVFLLNTFAQKKTIQVLSNVK